jgi:hypothetical protein
LWTILLKGVIIKAINREAKRLKEGNTNITSFFQIRTDNHRQHPPMRRNSQHSLQIDLQTNPLTYRRQATISKYFQPKQSESAPSANPAIDNQENFPQQPQYKKNDLRPP